MGNLIFRKSMVSSLIFPIIFGGALLVVYIFMEDVTPWILLGIPFAVVIFFLDYSKKVVIESDVIRYHSQLGSVDDVNLKKVAQISSEERETIQYDEEDGKNRRVVHKLTYLLDESGRTIFSFPTDLVVRKKRARFEEAVKSVNPDIKF